MTLFVDIDDLLRYVDDGNRRPTGIQRLTFELSRALYEAGQVRFLRHARLDMGYLEIAGDEVMELGARMASDQTPPASLPDVPLISEPAPLPPRRDLLRVRVPRRLRRMFSQPPPARPDAPPPPPPPLEPLVWPETGDVIFAPGAGWSDPLFAQRVAAAKRTSATRFALLVYDIIPLRRPEWTPISHVENFRRWLDTTLPLCDIVLTISEASAVDLAEYAKCREFVLPGGVRSIPLGTGFRATPHASAAAAGRIPEGEFVLSVSTIEARKNHQLLFRVWRRLLSELPRHEVPRLVFAGRIGWMVGDLMQQIANTNFLDGHIVLVEDADDAELAELYRRCLFTMFPSFFEGWGLPVSESLAFGRPCLVSATTSLPEAGGSLARYLDPDNVTEAVALVRDILADRAGLGAWEERIRREFRAVPWSESAAAVRQRLG